jgi:hypothetical protein
VDEGRLISCIVVIIGSVIARGLVAFGACDPDSIDCTPTTFALSPRRSKPKAAHPTTSGLVATICTRPCMTTLCGAGHRIQYNSHMRQSKEGPGNQRKHSEDRKRISDVLLAERLNEEWLDPENIAQ